MRRKGFRSFNRRFAIFIVGGVASFFIFSLLNIIFGTVISVFILFGVLMFLFTPKKGEFKYPKVQFNKLQSVSGSFLKAISKIPKIVWGAAAVFGVLAMGVMMGYAMGTNPEPSQGSPAAEIARQNQNLLRVIDGYEKISHLYSLQGQNVGVVLSPDIIYNHPEEIRDAMNSIDQYRSEIIKQEGKIEQLRQDADLPETPTTKSN